MNDARNGNSVLGWKFPGWGQSIKINDLTSGDVHFKRLDQPQRHMLGSWKATAICGNDISSSCLYVSALCAAQAGPAAPFVLLIVAVVLYLFRSVYAEVGSALPLNGGTYTVLLNTTNKRMAAAAACLTILSYVATAVISAHEALHYLHSMSDKVPVNSGTVLLLGGFAVLAIIGIGESAMVALCIFVLHMLTLTLLCIACFSFIISSPDLLHLNFQIPEDFNWGRSLFFGFAAAMLGISGFESSANFIEEQKEGVFPKTLRNMWIVVAIFNPLISFLSFGILSSEEITSVPPDLLARMGQVAYGPELAHLVSIDAFLVLSGAVLTSYVGVTGLMRRMSLDRCLPQFLLQENRLRATNHWIIIGFFVVCVSILGVTKGDITLLGGVYTLSFLSVMALFAIGNMMLKSKRAQLPRSTRATWPVVSFALIAVVLGILGNILLDPLYVEVFAIYYLAAGTIVATMFLRVQILRLFLNVSQYLLQSILEFNEAIRTWLLSHINRINEMGVVYFTGGDNAVTLNHAALYVMQNEQTERMIVVHVYQDEKQIPPNLAKHLSDIDHLYPQLRIDFVAVKGQFTPELIEALSKRLGVPKNYMFIGTPGDHFPYRIETLGGVRLIL